MKGMKRFHIHVYFEPDSLESARVLAERARLTNLFEFVEIHEQPIGPHPTGMIEAHFGDQSYISVLDWVEAHLGVFSALIHQDTGDDFSDHTEGARWLGKELPLNFDFFELIQLRPEFRIHQPVRAGRP
jgi:aromatic ring-cleaving dioxygenase